ncbi:hypothetical protein A9K55_007410 [Cordyceps militaris]|uniref:Uncharacterized protein n=1 Tax=Cordyceps militaris TaxID=73501 RepID=A0A2H4SG43_CORMI|nr:hypothetical protein A9K55_007410 [Cordyceps militaris]
MMGRPTEEIVYDQLFPRPKMSDPQNFQSFLQRSLIPEVRQETHAFYGHIETPEAKYPGLDYAHPTHRMRLSRWPWHRRLFRAFDGLGLTRFEIAGLTKWEGTKWAKEKYEKEQGAVIADTTADGIPTWQASNRWTAARSPAYASAAEEAEEALPSPSPSLLSDSPLSSGMSTPPYQPADEDDEDDEDEDSEDELESVGVELNARLRTQAARRDAGDANAVLDEAWEEWLKTALESGELAVVTEQMTETTPRRNRASSPSAVPAALVSTGMLDLARAGQWSDVPEFLQPMLREVVRGEEAPAGPSASNDPAHPELAATPRALRRQLTAATPRFAAGWLFGGRQVGTATTGAVNNPSA